MLACMLGKNREIFFPKLEKVQMMSFDAIATALLKAQGYEALECASDEEAIVKSEKLKYKSQLYPVHYSTSDTSGEKAYEEFYTEQETVDRMRYKALGVIVDKQLPDKNRIDILFESLEKAFSADAVTKDDIVKIIKEYLPNFEHIERGKSLDAKM